MTRLVSVVLTHVSGSLRPFVMQDFFRFKNGPFLPLLFLALFFLILFTSHYVKSYARLWQKHAFHFLRMIRTETTRTVGIYTAAVCTAAAVSTAGTPIVLYKEKGDALRIEPRPPSPSTCRLCARSSPTLFRPQASGDGTRMHKVLGESRASCRLSSWAGSNSGSQRQQYEELVGNS